MVIIKKDMSYLSETDLQAIENGIAELGVHSLRLDRYLSEEEKQENVRLANTNRELWKQRGEESIKRVATNIENILDTLNDQFLIYQYKNENISYSKDNWDLFFWCNNGDMSYVTLNTNKNKRLTQQLEDIENVLSVLNNFKFENVVISIQYNVNYNKEKVNNIVSEVFNKINNTFINYLGHTGKVKEIGKTLDGKTAYGFFKKGARTKYYQIPEGWFLSNFFNQDQNFNF